MYVPVNLQRTLKRAEKARIHTETQLFYTVCYKPYLFDYQLKVK